MNISLEKVLKTEEVLYEFKWVKKYLFIFKKRKVKLINEIEKLNWNTTYNSEEFIDLLVSDNELHCLD